MVVCYHLSAVLQLACLFPKPVNGCGHASSSKLPGPRNYRRRSYVYANAESCRPLFLRFSNVFLVFVYDLLADQFLFVSKRRAFVRSCFGRKNSPLRLLGLRVCGRYMLCVRA